MASKHPPVCQIFSFKDCKTSLDPIFELPAHCLTPTAAPIVIDNGSFQTRVGWAAPAAELDSAPRLIFRSVAARSRGAARSETQIGNDIPNLEPLRWLLKSQFDRNVVVNFEIQELILDHVFTHLGLSSEGFVEHPILMTEAPCNPLHCRQMMSELLFECYRVPFVSYGVDSLYSFYHNNNQRNLQPPHTGLILSSGYHCSHILPVVDGRLDAVNCKRLNVAGSQAASYLQRLLQLKYPGHLAAITLSRMEELLHEHSYTAVDYHQELEKWRCPEFYEREVHRMQLPFSGKVPGGCVSVEERQERRAQQLRRLQEINTRRREEKLQQDQERLDRLLAVQELLEDGLLDQFHKSLMELNMDSAEELQSYINKLQLAVEQGRLKLLQSDGAEGKMELIKEASPKMLSLALVGQAGAYRLVTGIWRRFMKDGRCFTTSAHQNASSLPSANQKTPSYSYVVIGAGSAGCVLANRLTEDPQESVCLLEAGPKDKWLGSSRLSWKIHMPAALTYNLCDDKYNWYYHTLPQAHMDNRVMYWPRGRVWGGSSSLNAMVYIRGHAEDYNRWQREGAEGWDYEHCLPYFRKAQCHELGENRYRGGSGPLRVSRGKTNHPLHKAFIEAGQQAGYPFTDDMNGNQQEGVGWMDMTIYKGKRWSSASAYLRPTLGRPNLKAEVHCMTTKILFDGKRAVGVEYVQSGKKKRVFADKEVILSGGAINSPQLLMLSGVGNADDLKDLGIPVIQHLPGVGNNLQDHLEIYVQQQCTQPITLYKAQKPFHMIKIGLEWMTLFTGYGATAHMESGGFIRSRPGVAHPDIQFHFLPSQVIDHGRLPSEIEAYQVHVGPMRSTSIGWMKLKSPNPMDHPIINPNYLATDIDVWEFRQCVKLSREIFAQRAFDPFRGAEVLPGPQVQSDADIDAFVRQKADTAYHPSCTCKMGTASDPMAVVDSNARVLGLERLRVVDASIMPSVVSGNLNAPTIMIAEKVADIIRGRPPLADPGVPVYQPPTLETQR